MKNLINVSSDKISLAIFGTGPGCAPMYHVPEGTSAILKRFEEVKGVFNEDGSFNPSYPKAEEYALCLDYEGKKEAALELFTLIVDGADKILFKTNDKFSMTVNTPRKLGVEGDLEGFNTNQIFMELKKLLELQRFGASVARC